MQMVVIKENIAPPSAYGLPDQTTRLEVISEFITPDQPEKRVQVLKRELDPIKRHIMASPDFLDETLLFGDVVMPPGIAFGLNLPDADNEAVITQPVGKHWQHFPAEGRSVLFESVEYLSLREDLNRLPDGGHRTVLKMPSVERVVPAKRLALRNEGPIQMASIEYHPRGVALDWEVVTGINIKTFYTGVTYLVSGTPWFGDVYFQPNCIIKFHPGAAIQVTTWVGCQGTAAQPSIFTGYDDDSVGEKIPAYGGFPASTGLPSNTYATRAIELSSNPANTFQHLKIRYAARGIYITSAPGLGGQHQVRDIIFERCTTALALRNDFGYGNAPSASNLKVCGVGNNVTVEGGAIAPPPSAFVRQCSGSSDSDNDGLPDNWETQYFGNLNQNASGDSDGEGLNNLHEQMYGTRPNVRDTDGDALSDFAEIAGGNFGQANFVDLAGMGADPVHLDIFVEADYFMNYGDNAISLRPFDESITRVVNAFAAAPRMNPDGTTGINLHFLVSDGIDASRPEYAEELDLDPVESEMNYFKNIYFTPGRRDYFHWCLFADKYPSNPPGSGGWAEYPGDDFLVTLGPTHWGRTVLRESATIMHELGHNLNLDHGGNEERNYKPNYLSVMNYNYSSSGLQIDGVHWRLDYSRLQIAAVSEQTLSEVMGLLQSELQQKRI